MAVNGHTNGVNGATSKGALCSVNELVSQKYDFVVVGGGTAGLAVAVRLTEDPNVTVAVLEAGEDRMNDKAVSTPSMYPTMVCKSRSRATQD
jgi:choline dehydrogenase-like flavoprotein